MKSIQFTLPEKYLNKQISLKQIINSLDGDLTCHQTKDGIAFIVDFESNLNGEEFNKKLNEIIPDIYKY